MRIAVEGPGEASERELTLAGELGRLIGEGGHDLYTGGLGGVMEAASRGAAEAGALVVGIVPDEEANGYVRVRIATGMGEARNLILVRSVDAVIAVGQGYGTLSEIAFALRLGKPVVLLESWAIGGGLAASSPAEALRLCC